MRILGLVLALATMVTAVDAIACPPPGPCNKYRRLARPQPAVAVYRMTSRGVPPARFDRRWLTRFLDGSQWLENGGSRSIRLVTAANADRAYGSAWRIVLIRELEQRRGVTYVAVDGVYYALGRCGNGTCLTLVGALPDPEQQRFATPP